MAFKNYNIHSITDWIANCVSDICLWMEQNKLKLNEEETDTLLIHYKFQNSPSLDEIILGNEQLTMAGIVTNLGIIFDKEMLFNDHINQLCRTFILGNLFKICKYLTDDATSKVVHAFVTTKLDYCNHLYFGLPKYQVNKMQRVQNTVVQLVTRSSKYNHITPLLQQLHWLPVLYCVPCLQSSSWTVPWICLWTMIGVKTISSIALEFSRTPSSTNIKNKNIWR